MKLYIFQNQAIVGNCLSRILLILSCTTIRCCVFWEYYISIIKYQASIWWSFEWKIQENKPRKLNRRYRLQYLEYPVTRYFSLASKLFRVNPFLGRACLLILRSFVLWLVIKAFAHFLLFPMWSFPMGEVLWAVVVALSFPIPLCYELLTLHNSQLYSIERSRVWN